MEDAFSLCLDQEKIEDLFFETEEDPAIFAFCDVTEYNERRRDFGNWGAHIAQRRAEMAEYYANRPEYFAAPPGSLKI